MCTIYVKKEDIVISVHELDIHFAYEFITQLIDDFEDRFKHYEYKYNRYSSMFVVFSFAGRYDDDVERCLRFYNSYFCSKDVELIFDDDFDK